jgi:hypothetical protein
VTHHLFERYIGIDYSGAQTPTASLVGLRVYGAMRSTQPEEVPPPPSPKRYWTRKGLAGWLNGLLGEPQPTIVGIDHAFSFPIKYFERHKIRHDWDAFLDDFCDHWPTDEDHLYVDFVRNGSHGKGALRTGNTRWRRLTEQRSGSAKSVFQFDVQGTVAKSSHSGIPWLRYLRESHRNRVHFWPFDGWEMPAGRHSVVEVYPRVWKGLYPAEGRNQDQHDAYTVCRWMKEADISGELLTCLSPDLSEGAREMARFEGWILGVK